MCSSNMYIFVIYVIIIWIRGKLSLYVFREVVVFEADGGLRLK